MALRGLCAECDRLLAQYQSASAELHLLCAQLVQAARSDAATHYAGILEECHSGLKRCDETRASFHQHVVSEHGLSEVTRRPASA